MAAQNDLDILKKLARPFEGPDDAATIPGWTFDTGLNKWVYTATGYQQNGRPTVIPISGWNDFFSLLELNDNDYQHASAVITGSILLISNAEEAAQAEDLVDKVLAEIDNLRQQRNKLRHVPIAGATPDPSAAMIFSKAATETLYGSHTIIGCVPLPPEVAVTEVEVVENYDTVPIRTLRGWTDPVIQGKKNEVMMSMTLTFPHGMINDSIIGGQVRYGLRGLLATLKIAPVCQIVSNALIPVYVNTVLTPDTFQKLKSQISKKMSEVTGAKEALKGAKQLRDDSVAMIAPNLEKFKEFIGTLDPVVDYLLAEGTSNDDFVNNGSKVDSGDLTEVIRRSSSISVPAAFRGAVLVTSPGGTNSVTVKLFFSKYNDQAWTEQRILYRDKDGGPTANPLDCPWIYKLASHVFLETPPEDENERSNYMEPYAPPRGERPHIKFTWDNPFAMDKMEYQPNQESFIINSVEVRSFMKVVSLPVGESVHPVAQYMGLDNLLVNMNICITDPIELTKLHEMKAELDQLLVMAQGPIDRRHFVTVQNNVINFMGAKDFLISNIVTKMDNATNKWDVQLTLIENRVSFQESEAIYLVNNASEVPDLKKLWGFVYDILSETVEWPRAQHLWPWEEAELTRNYQKIYPTDESSVLAGKNTFPGYLNAEGMKAWRLLFSDPSRSIMSGPMVMATWFYRTQKSKGIADKDIFWDTGIGNDLQVAAILGGSPFDNLSFSTAARAGRKGLTPSTLSYQAVGVLDDEKFGHAYIPSGNYHPASMFRIIDNGEGYKGFNGTQIRPLLPFEAEVQKQSYEFMQKGKTEALNSVELIGQGLGRPAGANIRGNFEDLMEWLSLGEGRKRVFFTREFWDDYVHIIMDSIVKPDYARYPAWTSTDISAARANLFSLIRGGQYIDFPSFVKKENDAGRTFPSYGASSELRVNLDKEPKGQKRVSNYADLKLPSYHTLFSTGSGERIVVTNNNSKEAIELWKLFAPTYGDLGRKPPYSRLLAFQDYGLAASQCARNINDPVDPDIPYYYVRLQDRVLAEADNGRKNVLKFLDEIQKNTIIIPEQIAKQGRNAIDRYIKMIMRDASARVNDEYTPEDLLQNLEEKRQLLNKVKTRKINNVSLISEKGVRLGHVSQDPTLTGAVRFIPVDGQDRKIFSAEATDGPIDPMSPDHVFRLHNDMLYRMGEINNRMLRMYPAYRLYFIETDRNVAYGVDDLYGRNAVVSVTIRDDKYDAALMVAEISNVTDNLGSESFLNADKAAELGLSPDEEAEPVFSSLKVVPGVNVQVRLGYGSLAEDLEIVFTGKITEVEPGQVYRIVAQGHKRELLNEVQLSYGGLNHFDIIKKIFEGIETPALGDTVSRSLNGNNFVKESLPLGVDPYQFVSWVDKLVNTKLTSALRNVYIPSNAPLEVSRRVYFRDDLDMFSAQGVSGLLGSIGNTILTVVTLGQFTKIRAALSLGAGLATPDFSSRNIATNAIGEGAGALVDSIQSWVGWPPNLIFSETNYNQGEEATWVVPLQTAWDAILEITRHRPGTIAQVVPFDTRATLFVGQPEQAYLAEVPPLDEQYTYDRLIAPVYYENKLQFEKDVIRPYVFNKTGWYGTYKTYISPGLTTTLARVALRSGPTAGDLNPSKLSNKTLFVDPANVVPLDSLPDGDDKETVLRVFGFGTGSDAGSRSDNKSIGNTLLRQTIYHVSPGGFVPKDLDVPAWWVYSDDLRADWDYLSTISPGLPMQLFYFFFAINSQKAELTPISSNFETLKEFMGPTDGNEFKGLLAELEIANSQFSVPYKNVTSLPSFINSFEDQPLPESSLEEGKFTPTGPNKDAARREALANLELRTGTKINIDVTAVAAFTDRARVDLLEDGVGQTLMEELSYVSAEKSNTVAAQILKYGGAWRLFMHTITEDIKERSSFDSTSTTRFDAGRVKNTLSRMRAFDLKPGYKVFRGYHLITSPDIIRNEIYASMAEMHNAVLVRSPNGELEYESEEQTNVQLNELTGQTRETEGENIILKTESTSWISYPTTDGLAFNNKTGVLNKKLAVVQEINAISGNQKMKCFLSNLANVMRPMYRGRLWVVGRHIKPHDIIYLRDEEKDLQGLFEAASVTHHFSLETGWVTEIEPHVHIRANNPTDELNTTWAVTALTWTGRLSGAFDFALAIGSMVLLAKGGKNLAARSPLISKISSKMGKFLVNSRTGIQNLTNQMRKSMLKDAATMSSKPGAIRDFARFMGTKGWTAARHIAGACGSTKGFFTLLALRGAGGLTETVINAYLKFKLEDTRLPMDVHILRYKGQPFTAGLEFERQDEYSMFEKFYNWGEGVHEQVDNFFVNLWDQVINKSPPFGTPGQTAGDLETFNQEAGRRR